jgi:hypothetical protein
MTLLREERRMSTRALFRRSETPFSRHSVYYIALKLLVIAIAVAAALSVYDVR